MIGSFADDIRLWQVIKADLGTNILQQKLQHMCSCSEQNNMHCNSGKFKHMRYGKSKEQAIYFSASGTEIKQKACTMDLGVFMSEDAKFDVRIKNTAAAGHRLAGWALGTFKARSWYPILTLLKTLVVSKIEYCCPLWSSADSRNINLSESVQRRFTSRFSAFQTYDLNLQMPICTVSYVDRLKRLKYAVWKDA